jgi:iron complex outermembrane receptor protein
MRAIKNFLFLWVIFYSVAGSIPIFGQTTVSRIQGAIANESKAPLSRSTVMLLQAKDSSLVKTTIADGAGEFFFENVKPGEYIIKVSYVGFRSLYSPVFNYKAITYNIGQLILYKMSKELAEARIMSERPFVEQKLDRTIINVENGIITAGNSALEVLQRSPGVTVDDIGRFTLNGKQGPMIMIDGKPTYLSTEDLLSLLRNMPSAQLDRIELMNNAPAKYEAEGNAGIINIRTKKSQAIGFNGSLNSGYTQGKFPKFNSGINFNYRKHQFNIFGGYHYYQTNFFFDIASLRTLIENNDPKSSFDQDVYVRMKSNSQNLKFGTDFFLGKNGVLGIVLTGIKNDNTNSGYTYNSILNSSMQNDSSISTISKKENPWDQIALNINFKYNFNSKGQELSADLDHISFSQNGKHYFTTNTYNNSGSLINDARSFRASLPGTVDIWATKIDFTKPLSKKVKIETGAKFSYVSNDNDFQFYKIANGSAQLDSGQSNHFIYREHVAAGYVIYNQEIANGSLQIGLRGENTTGSGAQLATNNQFKRKYFQLFPSVFFSKGIGHRNRIGISYSRRLNRPSYRDLNPFRSYHDSYSYTEGNPLLKPQFSHNLEFSYAYQQNFSTRLYYTRTTDIMSNMLHQENTTGISFLRIENVDRMSEFGVTANLGFGIASWWKINVFLNLYNRTYSGVYEGSAFSNERIAYNINISNNLRLGKGYSMEFSGFYISKRTGGLFIDAAGYIISSGIQKSFKNVNLRLAFNDITWGMRGGSTMDFKNVLFISKVKWDNRTVAITFNYKFGKNSVKDARQHSSGAEDEKGRVKTEN